MFLSYPILASLLGVLIAQFVKIPIHYLATGRLQWNLLFSTGGMPSSHTASIIALTTAIGMTTGIDSNEFAIALVVSLIVMHDATGVRRHAGYHAATLNKLLDDFNRLIDSIRDHQFEKTEYRGPLKELLGHKPLEVFFGIITGILIAVGTYYIYPF
ncbi:divergent PAP2 family protein [Neobacillus notoginsengisoli]|uniref:Divergent PAP2 family protein n=1 Tax=Neobacillus notoginsengisoli TaxID=1578198 RepID=A0A417YTJ1_9BACI|nr:divergent PAP2 family protein [Neobacillus notoginsengisoli]RHW40372.1 divergent PAP2 family protein [Neobacillus notoginsengisoli]